MSELPDFETMYLEFQPRTDGTIPHVSDVLAVFRERRIAGVAVSGDRFGLTTPVVAKVAITMHDDTAVVFTTTKSGELELGEFAGQVCADLAVALSTDLIADEYVKYQPTVTLGEPAFVELDPRRQSIDQPAGFPNEWRVSPTRLHSRAIAFADGPDVFPAHAIARDTDSSVALGSLGSSQYIEIPAGVVELPQVPAQNPKQRVVLCAQAGEAKYAQLVIGKSKNPLRLTFANLPRFSSAQDFSEGTPAAHLMSLITNAGLVTGSVNMNHPNFPHHVLPRYPYLSDPTNTHSFFGEIAELLSLPEQLVALAEGGFPSFADEEELTRIGVAFDSIKMVAPDAPLPKKTGLFRR